MGPDSSDSVSLSMCCLSISDIDEATRQMHKDHLVKKRVLTTVTDIIFYAAYLLLLIAISDDIGGSLPYLQTQNVKNIFSVSLVTENKLCILLAWCKTVVVTLNQHYET